MQKNIGLSISLLLIFSLVAGAQFKKGNMMAGANVGSVLFNSGSSDITVAQIGGNTSKITSYNVNLGPSLGWFISDKTAVGASLNINPSGNKTTYEQSGSTYQSDKITNFNIGIGGFVRHYFGHSGSMIPFGQFGINAGISSFKTEGFFYGGSSPSAYKTSYDGSANGGFFANSTFQLGMTKMVGDFTGLDFYIGYNFSYNKNTFKKTTLRDDGNDGSIDSRGENETTSKFTNHGFLLGVGFQVFLKGKNK
ncbi:MAG TPA: hypothetical protein VN451_06150 [Chitinophagaceae bacterium]|nr:hypothetical protein [Chitinophagaceae bacterium]